MLVRKPKTLRPIRANAGIEAQYRAALDALIAEMQESYLYWLKATWKANKPATLAMDRTAASDLNDALHELGSRWLKRFDDFAGKQAPRFASATLRNADQGMKKALKEAGFTIEYRFTDPMRDAYQAVIAENIGLIKSIPAQYHTQIEGDVMRAVSRGGDLGPLAKTIEQRFGVTKRRAALIARDQANKANAVITRVRQIEAGITEAIWCHSHAGRFPRPSHVAANGKTYKITEGMKIEGEMILPGEKVNCRCVARPVLPGLS